MVLKRCSFSVDQTSWCEWDDIKADQCQWKAKNPTFVGNWYFKNSVFHGCQWTNIQFDQLSIDAESQFKNCKMVNVSAKSFSKDTPFWRRFQFKLMGVDAPFQDS